MGIIRELDQIEIESERKHNRVLNRQRDNILSQIDSLLDSLKLNRRLNHREISIVERIRKYVIVHKFLPDSYRRLISLIILSRKSL